MIGVLTQPPRDATCACCGKKLRFGEAWWCWGMDISRFVKRTPWDDQVFFHVTCFRELNSYFDREIQRAIAGLAP